MDFNKLLAKMVELDRPVGESQVQECGEPMMGMGQSMPNTPPHTPPSLSINLNAQGMDDIESIMKLMTKVNPDMINQKAPLNAMPHAAEIEPIGMPSLTPPGPGISSIGDLGDLDKGPLKMLPDLGPEPKDHAEPDADNMGGPSDNDADNSPVADIQKAMGDVDGDGDHDMDDHEAEEDDADDADDEKAKPPFGDKEKDESADRRDAYQRDFDSSQTGFGKQERENDEGDDEDTDEAWANEPDEKYQSVDYMNNQLAGGMNKPKTMHKHSYKQGDNPMAMEGSDLRASIRAELLQRLAEAKGAK